MKDLPKDIEVFDKLPLSVVTAVGVGRKGWKDSYVAHYQGNAYVLSRYVIGGKTYYELHDWGGTKHFKKCGGECGKLLSVDNYRNDGTYCKPCLHLMYLAKKEKKVVKKAEEAKRANLNVVQQELHIPIFETPEEIEAMKREIAFYRSRFILTPADTTITHPIHN